VAAPTVPQPGGASCTAWSAWRDKDSLDHHASLALWGLPPPGPASPPPRAVPPPRAPPKGRRPLDAPPLPPPRPISIPVRAWAASPEVVRHTGSPRGPPASDHPPTDKPLILPQIPASRWRIVGYDGGTGAIVPNTRREPVFEPCTRRNDAQGATPSRCRPTMGRGSRSVWESRADSLTATVNNIPCVPPDRLIG